LGVIPDLGSKEHLFPRDTGIPDTVPYPSSIPIDRCGIHMAIPLFEGDTHSNTCLFITGLPYA
jgi:hypothetical protein